MQTSPAKPLNPSDYYRLPWTLTDNILGWLEPTKRCNLYCQGCYSRNDPKSDKTLAEIRRDMEVFVRNRRMDSISIAGGDPLMHPDIVEIVRMVRHDFGLKPILNTNALALTPELLKELRAAGNAGFTFHIDSSQNRPGWRDKSEIELNALRLRYAEMVAEVGGMCVAFNSTVFRHTMHHTPELMEWARQHIDIVHSMVFILFRTSRQVEHDYYADGKKVDVQELVYFGQNQHPEPITAHELVAVIREKHPEYEPCAYLGGTHDPGSFKWLLAFRVGTKKRLHGYLGRRYMELIQAGNHLLFGRYFAYSHPRLLSLGRSMALLASTFDRGARGAIKSYLDGCLRSPAELLRPMHAQSVVIIQPIDFMADGAANMCDGCPDMTVFDGQLVWSCRLDERIAHGCFLQAVPKIDAAESQKRRLQTVPSEPSGERPVVAV
ncbi:radical SAM protein [Myxococcota bacterium]